MRNFAGKITDFLASQARHGMGAQWSCSPRETWSRKCAKVRIVSRSYAKVHESSHRSGPWLRDVTHCYGWEAFLDANFASQARHEMGAQCSCSLARNVVTNERELGKH